MSESDTATINLYLAKSMPDHTLPHAIMQRAIIWLQVSQVAGLGITGYAIEHCRQSSFTVRSVGNHPSQSGGVCYL